MDALTDSETEYDWSSEDDLPLAHFVRMHDTHNRNGDRNPQLLTQVESALSTSMNIMRMSPNPLVTSFLSPATANALDEPEIAEMCLTPAHTHREQVSKPEKQMSSNSSSSEHKQTK